MAWNRLKLWLIAFLASVMLGIYSLAYAQSAGVGPQPNPVDTSFLQAAIAEIQMQRNAAYDAEAVAKARIVGLNDQIAKLQARVAELEKKPEPPK